MNDKLDNIISDLRRDAYMGKHGYKTGFEKNTKAKEVEIDKEAEMKNLVYGYNHNLKERNGEIENMKEKYGYRED
ncbi:hypothetical protein OW763_12400 [Clostridium aestuarii]|uniref:Uncharacterized protein n=1 Tax=Clostridium aestuarii TaxID=338193 RepID=A0ABT4D1M8_9CLOT|nr:hypothetical protein [Clostridium aestuarii]MCY6485139.1 hypothetical protein [Clostridium aestuarii]